MRGRTEAPAAAPAANDVPPPVFRPRRDIEKPDAARIPAVIPIVRAPDDPGVADEVLDAEFDDPVKPEQAQAGGWKGFCPSCQLIRSWLVVSKQGLIVGQKSASRLLPMLQSGAVASIRCGHRSLAFRRLSSAGRAPHS